MYNCSRVCVCTATCAYSGVEKGLKDGPGSGYPVSKYLLEWQGLTQWWRALGHLSKQGTVRGLSVWCLLHGDALHGCPK